MIIDVKGSKELYLEHARLLDKLFLDYDKVSRPGSQYPVNVTLGIAVAQLVKVVSKNYSFRDCISINHPNLL